MKNYEKSKADKLADKKFGYKEGSKKDEAMDAKLSKLSAKQALAKVKAMKVPKNPALAARNNMSKLVASRKKV